MEDYAPACVWPGLQQQSGNPTGKNYTAKLVTRLLPMAPLLLDLRKGKMWSPFYLPTESKAAHVLNFPGAIFVPALSASSQWTAGAKYNIWLIFGCDNLQRRNMVGSLRVKNGGIS